MLELLEFNVLVAGAISFRFHRGISQSELFGMRDVIDVTDRDGHGKMVSLLNANVVISPNSSLGTIEVQWLACLARDQGVQASRFESRPRSTDRRGISLSKIFTSTCLGHLSLSSIPVGSKNRVLASAGVMTGTSPLSGGR